MRTILHLTLAAMLVFGPKVSLACTGSIPSLPEIEIEIQFEDYDVARDRVLYQIEIEAEVMAPTQSAVCQCGLGLGSTAFKAPDSFSVLDAVVGVAKADGDNFGLDAFEGFRDDDGVAASISQLLGFRAGATSFGFSADVSAFDVPKLGAEDAFFLGFLIEFDPDDFDAVNGNTIQFAAGSNEPSHPLNLFRNYQPTLQLPRFQLHECDFNLDLSCDARDLDALYSLGPINTGFARTDATEKYDLNGDDRIDLFDLDEWLEGAADYNGLPSAYVYGDADLDGLFNSSDFVTVFLAGGYESGEDGQTWETGDWNGDGLFNSSDFIRAFKTGAYEQVKTASVPEPNSAGTFALLSIALSAWARVRQRSTPR